MKLTPIQVESPAPYQIDRLPSRFQIKGQSVEVSELLDSWFQGPGNPEWPEADYFKVIGHDSREYLLKHDLEVGQWFLVQQG